MNSHDIMRYENLIPTRQLSQNIAAARDAILDEMRQIIADKEIHLLRSEPASKDALRRLKERLNVAQNTVRKVTPNATGIQQIKRLGNISESTKRRLTQLDILLMQADVVAAELAAKNGAYTLDGLNELSKEAWQREVYNHARQAGGAFLNQTKLPDSLIYNMNRKLIPNKTLGTALTAVYDKFSSEIKKSMTTGIARGAQFKEIATEIQERTGITQRAAKAIVRTTSNAAANTAVKEVQERNSLIKGYIYNATLDSRTSHICQKLDGKYFSKEAAEVGVNYPPMHVNCRSTTTTVYFNEDEKTLQLSRMGRNAEGQWVGMPDGMTYSQWKEHVRAPHIQPPPERRFTMDEIKVKGRQELNLLNKIERAKVGKEPYPQISEILEHPAVKRMDRMSVQVNRQYGNTAEINTPQRVQLRTEIRDRVLRQGSAVIQPDGSYKLTGEIARGNELHIVTGLPATGKSTMVAEPLSMEKKAFVLDSDEVKKEIPEFKASNGAAAGSVHKESKQINKQVMEQFLTGPRKGENVVLPIIGDKVESIMEYAKAFEAAGYTINIHMKESISQHSINHAIARGISSGRIIPTRILNEYKQPAVKRAFESVIERKPSWKGRILSAKQKWGDDELPPIDTK